jgi:predicted MFS family arabinose efflux permease
MIGSGNWGHVAAALRHRDHRLFNYTLLPALLSLWAQRTGIGWLAWELTHSPSWLGIIAAADLLPSVFLSPLSGVIADRVNAVRMMRLTQAIIMVHAAVLWAMTAAGIIEIWGLFVLALITGINQPFSTSARMVYYPTLVPREDLGTAITINSTVFNLGRAAGPALAGVLIGPFGVATVFFLNFAAFLAHLLNLLRIHGVHAEDIARKPKGMFREAREGLGYAARHAGIGPMLLLLVLTSVAGRPVPEMLPGFADDVFGRGPEGLGWLLSAVGVGGLAGAIWLTRRGAAGGLTVVVVFMTMVMGVATAIFGLTDWFWLGIVFLAVVGFTQTVTGTGIQALLQIAVAPEVRGRVMSLYTAVWRGTPAFGAILIGWIADHAGLPWTVTGAGVILVLSWMWARSLQDGIAAALEARPESREIRGA